MIMDREDINSPIGSPALRDFLQGKITRAQLLKAAGIGAAAAVLPGAALADSSSTSYQFFPQVTGGSYTTESVQEIVSNLLTLMYFDATAGALVLSTPAIAGVAGVTGLMRTVFQAAIAAEQYHIDFWSKLVPGAAPKATTFTIDPKLAASPQAFIGTVDLVSVIRAAAATTAVREFAELGQPTLAKNAAQLATNYAAENAAIRTIGAQAGAAADTPPNNRAFWTDLFLYTRDAVAAYAALGVIGGSGITVPYPGRDAVLKATGSVAAQVIQKAPNNASSTVTITGPASFLAERT